ncbi:DHS-like NAD/FAD-binding domain-containing protein [Gorgonomyces haynaldii]|nr:DHS-like NAD/FAD-binding domain-containing protein [Gorgonomyces haynaldii]
MESEPEAKRIKTMEFPDPTDEQKVALRDEARGLGFWSWLEKYQDYEILSLFKIFDVQVPDEMKEMHPEELLPVLKYAFMMRASKRERLPQYSTVEDAVDLIRKSKNIVVLTGAGCSVSCGIPDFRSKNGIYSRLQEFDLTDPQEMFDLNYFRIRPETFYSFAHEIYPSNFKPSPSHYFIKLLEKKGKLLNNYTQNIDTLESIAGIKRVIQCHGSFATCKCIECGHTMPGKEIEADIFAKQVPICKVCPGEDKGVIKPGIVFFGEKLPLEFDMAFAQDRTQVDLLIVIGSSLKVAPVADVKDHIPSQVPQILINREALPHMRSFDIQLIGYSDAIVKELVRLLGWEQDFDFPVDQPGQPWTRGELEYVSLLIVAVAV